MADLSEVTKKDIVLDPACGTGGFLIAVMRRLQTESHLTRDEIVKIVKKHLIGFEDEPITAALCVANMILRGDGSTGIHKDDCFTTSDYPTGKANIVLMNPPFPHEKTDRPPSDFIDRALEGLQSRGILTSIIPYSLLVRMTDWHRNLLEKHSLLFICTLPPDLFNPYASYNTAIISIQKGVPHGIKPVFVCRLVNDGFKLKKRMRVHREGSQILQLLSSYKKKLSIPEFCAFPEISKKSREWSPEAYIESAAPSNEDFIKGFEEFIRKQAAFYIQFGHRLISTQNKNQFLNIQDAFSNISHITLKGLEMHPFKVSNYFHIELGGRDEIEDLDEGNIPFVSTSEFNNGIREWRKPNVLYSAPAITVATDGSTCSSFVQEIPFYAFYKVAILRPKIQIPTDAFYFVAYLLSRERWRYVYARKFGKLRISETKIYGPSKNGKPDFEIMAKLTKSAKAFPIIHNFRNLVSKNRQ